MQIAKHLQFLLAYRGKGINMITIDEKTYTEEDLNEAQIAQVQRVNILKAELNQLEMQAQEINVLISAYANAIKESLTEEE